MTNTFPSFAIGARASVQSQGIKSLLENMAVNNGSINAHPFLHRESGVQWMHRSVMHHLLTQKVDMLKKYIDSNIQARQSVEGLLKSYSIVDFLIPENKISSENVDEIYIRQKMCSLLIECIQLSKGMSSDELGSVLGLFKDIPTESTALPRLQIIQAWIDKINTQAVVKAIQCQVNDCLPEKLHNLNLSNLGLTRLTSESYDAITALVTICSIDLSYNQLTQLDDDVQKLSSLPLLTRINLNSNRIKDISHCLFELPQLKLLDISDNPCSNQLNTFLEISKLKAPQLIIRAVPGLNINEMMNLGKSVTYPFFVEFKRVVNNLSQMAEQVSLVLIKLKNSKLSIDEKNTLSNLLTNKFSEGVITHTVYPSQLVDLKRKLDALHISLKWVQLQIEYSVLAAEKPNAPDLWLIRSSKHLDSLSSLTMEKVNELDQKLESLNTSRALHKLEAQGFNVHATNTQIEQLYAANLSFCGITRLTSAVIERLKQFPRLFLLDLNMNKLTTLPMALSVLDIREIKLIVNSLEEFPAALLSTPKLTVVDLASNKISSLPDELANRPLMTKLGLYGNPIFEQFPDLKAFQAAVKLKAIQSEAHFISSEDDEEEVYYECMTGHDAQPENWTLRP